MNISLPRDGYLPAEYDPSVLPQEVFQAELETIAKRRASYELAAVGADRAGQNWHRPAANLGLVGLSFSGGGIRSATFSLGVAQALAEADLLKRADYLSTVSGGGYIGASLTWLLSRKALEESSRLDGADRFGVEPCNFPYANIRGSMHGPGSGKPRAAMAKFLRQHGNYLAPGKGITVMSGLSIVLRGILLNIFVWLPLTVALMVALLGLSK